MLRNRAVFISLSFLIILACVILPSVTAPTTGPASTPTTGFVSNPTAAPGDFKAEATSPNSVLLTWKAVDGAIGSHLEYSWNGKDFHPLIDLPAVLTQYEDFLAQPDSTLTYRIQAVTAAAPGAWLFANVTTGPRVPNPVTVQPAYAEDKAVTQTIGPAGGVISMTDASGVSYELNFPAGALAADTEIQLIPVTGMDGWPLDGDRLAAVRIEPFGLQLLDVATLKIRLPTDPKPGLATVGFAFEPSGNEFHLRPVNRVVSGTGYLPPRGVSRHLAAPLLQTPRVITLPVIELNGNGAGQASTGKISDLAHNNTPTDPTAAADQQQAAADLYDEDLGRLVYPPGQTQVDNSPARRLENEAVKIVEQVDKAVDGATLDSAMEQFQQWQKESNLLTPDQSSSMSNIIWDAFTSKFKDLLDKAADECKHPPVDYATPGTGKLQQMVQSASTPAATGSFWDVVKSKMTGAFGEDVLDIARAGLKQGECGSYQPYQGEQFKGNICSLARPFTLTQSVVSAETTTFFPNTLDVGLVHDHNVIDVSTYDGFGRYDVTFYSNGEADIRFESAGILVVGDHAIPGTQRALHVRIRQAIIPACP